MTWPVLGATHFGPLGPLGVKFKRVASNLYSQRQGVLLVGNVWALMECHSIEDVILSCLCWMQCKSDATTKTTPSSALYATTQTIE